jgi:hypothetical protein
MSITPAQSRILNWKCSEECREDDGDSNKIDTTRTSGGQTPTHRSTLGEGEKTKKMSDSQVPVPAAAQLAPALPLLLFSH